LKIQADKEFPKNKIIIKNTAERGELLARDQGCPQIILSLRRFHPAQAAGGVKGERRLGSKKKKELKA
jgi:hypothetical protein